MNTNPAANAPGPATSAPAPAPVSAPATTSAPASAPSSAPSGDPGTRVPETYVSPSRGRGPATAEDIAPILERGRDPTHRLSIEDVAALLSFDTPLGPKAAAPAPKAGQPADPLAPPAVDPNAPPVAPAAPAAPAVPATPQAFVEAVREIVGNQPPAAPQEPSAPTRAQPYYGGSVPALEVTPELFSVLMNAENPQQSHQAMNFLVNSMMNRMIEDSHRSMLSMAKAIMTNVPKMIPSHIQASSVQEKFNSKFPELNKPILQEMVKTIAGNLASARRAKNLPIDDSFIDELGEASHKFLEAATGKSFRANSTIAPTPPQNLSPVAAPPAVRETFYTSGGARPNGGVGSNGQADWRDLVL